jgi:hypothetical protein
MTFDAPLPNQIISLRVGIRTCDKKDGREMGFCQLLQYRLISSSWAKHSLVGHIRAVIEC